MTDSQCEKAMFRGNFRLLEYQSLCNINEVGRGTCTTVNTHLAGLHSRYQRMIGVPDVFGIITCRQALI